MFSDHPQRSPNRALNLEYHCVQKRDCVNTMRVRNGE